MMEAGGDDRGGNPARSVLNEGVQEIGAAGLERALAGLDGGRVLASLAGVGELLELDRGLALVVDRVPHPEDGRGGVEQASPPGRHPGVEALADPAAYHPPPRRLTA